MKAKLQRSANHRGYSPEKAVCESLGNAVSDDGSTQAPLGSRIADRFAGLGLTRDIPELRGEEARPADFES